MRFVIKSVHEFVHTTFCLNRSSLSHFRRATSWRRASACWAHRCGEQASAPDSAWVVKVGRESDAEPLSVAEGLSAHSEQALVVASAEDMDSSPVSESTYTPPPRIWMTSHWIMDFSLYRFFSLLITWWNKETCKYNPVKSQS